MNKPVHQLELWQCEDAARLRALFKKYRDDGGLKQEDFAPEYSIGSQGNMGHYLHGRRPLNIETARKFAKGLGVSIEAFSPTLAEKIAAAHQTTRAAKFDGWPFPDIDPERFTKLSANQKIEIQGLVRERMERFESPTLPAQERAPAAEGRAAANGHNPSKKRSNGQ